MKAMRTKMLNLFAQLDLQSAKRVQHLESRFGAQSSKRNWRRTESAMKFLPLHYTTSRSSKAEGIGLET